MEHIEARITTVDMSAWTSDNIAIVTAIPGVTSTTVEGDCCLNVKIPIDTSSARVVVKAIAKAFPDLPVIWVSPTSLGAAGDA
jgi:hypothetical protein